ncbi:MAG: LysE family translocator [Pseudomonadota bacterium]
MTFEIFLSLAIFSFVTSITPGPNNIMLLTSGVNFGTRRTLPHFAGVNIGIFLLFLFIGLGLGQIFTLYPQLYMLMKIAGILYFIYLAWKIIRSTPPEDSENDTAKPITFIEAVLFQWVNPKALLVAASYFSSYTPPDSGSGMIITMSIIYGIINAPCIGVWVLGGSNLRRYLHNQTYFYAFNWTMAILLILSLMPIVFSTHL